MDAGPVFILSSGATDALSEGQPRANLEKKLPGGSPGGVFRKCQISEHLSDNRQKLLWEQPRANLEKKTAGWGSWRVFCKCQISGHLSDNRQKWLWDSQHPEIF